MVVANSGADADKSDDGGSFFESTEAVQERTEDSKWTAHARDVARVVVVADGQHQMVQSLCGNPIMRREACQIECENRRVEAIAGVVSNRELLSTGFQITSGICGGELVPGGGAGRKCAHERVVRRFTRIDQPVGRCRSLLDFAAEQKREDPTCTDAHVVIPAALELSLTQLRPPMRLPEGEVRSSEPALHRVRRRIPVAR